MALKEELAAKQVAVQELGKGLTQGSPSSHISTLTMASQVVHTPSSPRLGCRAGGDGQRMGLLHSSTSTAPSARVG